MHDKPWVFQSDESSEKLMFVIELSEEFFVFPRSKAKADVCFNAKVDLLADIFDHEGVYSFSQFFAVVIIVIGFFAFRIDRRKS